MKKKSQQTKSSNTGIKIRAARLSAGMSQMKLAEKIGISYQQVQKYENGRSELTIKRLQQFSKALNLPLYYFLNENNHLKTSEPEIRYCELNKDEIKLIKLLRRMNNRKFTLKLFETIKTIIDSKIR